MPPPVPPVPELDYRDRNTAAIIAAADAAGVGVPGRLIGIMVALDESDMNNYSNYRVPLSEQVPNDGDPPRGPDAMSLGLFQQQQHGPPWWWGHGTTADEITRQLMTPRIAADLFYERLKAVVGWQAMDPWVAAQTVQKSGTPDGSNYRARLPKARLVLAAFPLYWTKGGK